MRVFVRLFSRLFTCSSSTWVKELSSGCFLLTISATLSAVSFPLFATSTIACTIPLSSFASSFCMFGKLNGKYLIFIITFPASSLTGFPSSSSTGSYSTPPNPMPNPKGIWEGSFSRFFISIVSWIFSIDIPFPSACSPPMLAIIFKVRIFTILLDTSQSRPLRLLCLLLSAPAEGAGTRDTSAAVSSRLAQSLELPEAGQAYLLAAYLAEIIIHNLRTPDPVYPCSLQQAVKVHGVGIIEVYSPFKLLQYVWDLFPAYPCCHLKSFFQNLRMFA